MEDYDVFNEMNNLDKKRTVIVVENNEKFIMNIINMNYEIMPIRFDYDLSDFSKKYIDDTKKYFIYYYSEDNKYENEILRLKKHLIHFQRKPIIAYIPRNKKYNNLRKMIIELGIECISNKKSFIDILKK